ncbi:MAG: hypothetical protein WCV90_01510 [Candidatus Woesearchaeota archaeon]|jgi:hypothetical protein
MARKSIGTEYKIIAECTWAQVAEVTQVSKTVIERTQSQEFLDQDFVELEDRILKAYLVPKDEESFTDYRTRYIQTLTGGGLRGGFLSLYFGKKVLLGFQLALDLGGSKSALKVNSTLREGSYQALINASGTYQSRGGEIATSIKTFFERRDIKYAYVATDKPI